MKQSQAYRKVGSTTEGTLFWILWDLIPHHHQCSRIYSLHSYSMTIHTWKRLSHSVARQFLGPRQIFPCVPTSFSAKECSQTHSLHLVFVSSASLSPLHPPRWHTLLLVPFLFPVCSLDTGIRELILFLFENKQHFVGRHFDTVHILFLIKPLTYSWISYLYGLMVLCYTYSEL